MKELVASFPQQLKEAIEIGERFETKKSGKTYAHIVVAGLGGSGIGATMVGNLLESTLTIPFYANKTYSLPKFVNENTLVIACSYSGNTEETLSAISKAQQLGCDIMAITTGGELKRLAKENDWPHIILPEGLPPRAAFAYSFTQYFYMLSAIDLIPLNFRRQISSALSHLMAHEDSIKKAAADIANLCHGKIPVIYATSVFAGLTVRWKQQINENAKMLCWQNVLPEMNHNELVGWGADNPEVCAVFLSSSFDFYRNKKRMDISKEVIGKRAGAVIEAPLKGMSVLEQTFYAVLLGDWVSVYLAEKKGIDPVEVNIIDYLKSNLKNLSSENS